MIYADGVDTITMGRTIDCTASTGEGPAARFLLDVCCGSIIQPIKYYDYESNRFEHSKGDCHRTT